MSDGPMCNGITPTTGRPWLTSRMLNLYYGRQMPPDIVIDAAREVERIYDDATTSLNDLIAAVVRSAAIISDEDGLTRNCSEVGMLRVGTEILAEGLIALREKKESAESAQRRLDNGS